MDWYRGYINLKNNKYLVFFCISVLIILFFSSINYYLKEQSNFDWTKKDIIIIKDGYYYTFITPYSGYDNIKLDIRNFVAQDKILDFTLDSKIDKNKLVITYVNRSLDLMLYIKSKSDYKTIKIESVDNQSVYSIYPKLWITNLSYYIFIDRYLYKIDKQTLEVKRILSDISGVPSIGINGNVIYKDDKNYISVVTSEETKKLFLSPRYSSLQGWGSDSDSFIIGLDDKIENISLLGIHKYTIVKPSYGDIKVEGDLGRFKIVQFVPDSGEEPFIDWTLWWASLKDGIEYKYYHYYVYDSQNNRFYELPNQLLELFSDKAQMIIGYSGEADLEVIFQLTLLGK